MLKKCPQCGRKARQKIEYRNGEPLVHYVCACGYDDVNVKIIYSTNTPNDKQNKELK